MYININKEKVCSTAKTLDLYSAPGFVKWKAWKWATAMVEREKLVGKAGA